MNTYYKKVLRESQLTLLKGKKKDYFPMPNGESFDNDATILETLWEV